MKKRQILQKLPDRPELTNEVRKEESKNEKRWETLIKARGPGNSCPPISSDKKYNVTAFMKDIQYNKYGDHDPFGMMFSLSQDIERSKVEKSS